MIKLIIFDLDNTLFDTYEQLGMHVLDQMIEKMKSAGLTDEQEKVLREKYVTTGFRTVANMLKLSDELKAIGKSTYENMDLSKITPFDDVKLIKRFSQKKILVTSGTERVQNEKIRILGIAPLFDEIIVDLEGSGNSRMKIFMKLTGAYEVRPKEVLVIGDNAEAEIIAGNNLGMITVQIFRRHFLKGKADYYVKDLHEVKKILDEMS
ncbi:MAG: HAD hydrolase-like protein [Nanoarchaeota archaeon]|nr:HAD hydrolase-like protein [Nanoarchaeota archaeon]MBU1321427.1 HAD hydrolase-like protein [Nanoarchaeota archaeon]MBU1597053.1 HAD hydrolase-like protein [Nanoarchaeota archaeon]MBU2440843.1 HAD hydrolase-like protein [Nanoarchaeota archaeon]